MRDMFEDEDSDSDDHDDEEDRFGTGQQPNEN